MHYAGNAIEQLGARAQPIRDAKPRPNRRVTRIQWQTWAWAGVLAIIIVMGGSW